MFDEPLTATEALERAGADIAISKHPVWTRVEGRRLLLPTQRAVVREPTPDDPEPRVLAVVAKDYTVVSNRDIARVLDPLTAEWPVETVGVLGQGETLFLTLDAGMTTVAGEDVHEYFAVSDGKDGRRSLRVFYTPVRVVCQKTLATGISAATTMIRLRHTTTIGVDYRISVEMMAELRKAREAVKARLEHLAAMRLAEEQVAEILRQTYPQPDAPSMVTVYDAAGDLVEAFDADTRVRPERLKERHAAEMKRVREYREAARELYMRFNDEQPRLARTGWALYNAVVESADWRGKNAPRSVAMSALFGERAAEKARCFGALEALAGNGRTDDFHASAGYRGLAEAFNE